MLLNAAMTNHQGHARNIPHGDETPDFRECLADIAQYKNKDSFITLFNHFAPRIKSFLMKGGLTPETADELAQETMLTIWNKATSYNPATAAPSTWIFTIARNKRIDHLRKTNRYHIQSDENLVLEDESPTPPENLSRSEETAKIAAAIKKLPPDQLALIKQSFFEDKSHAQIAEETGIPLGTVKSRIRLALGRLRAQTNIQDLWKN